MYSNFIMDHTCRYTCNCTHIYIILLMDSVLPQVLAIFKKKLNDLKVSLIFILNPIWYAVKLSNFIVSWKVLMQFMGLSTTFIYFQIFEHPVLSSTWIWSTLRSNWDTHSHVCRKQALTQWWKIQLKCPMFVHFCSHFSGMKFHVFVHI